MGVTLVPFAYANGRVVSYTTKTAGPYEVGLGTIPRTPVVGNLHLSLRVQDASTSGAISAASVTVVGVGPANGSNVGPIAATPDLLSPSFYDVNLRVDRVGAWEFTVEVSGSLGDSSAVFDLQVRTVNPLPGIITVVVLVAFLIILGLSLRAYLRERRLGQRRRKAR